jgi:hypothetical protein
MPLERYLHIFDRQVDVFYASGFVVRDDLSSALDVDTSELVIRGRIRCEHDLFVDVDVTLAIRDQDARPTVWMTAFSYHAGIEGPVNRPIFRYDNAHGYPGHADIHHKHHFNHTTWKRIDPPEWIGEANCPQLVDIPPLPQTFPKFPKFALPQQGICINTSGRRRTPTPAASATPTAPAH